MVGVAFLWMLAMFLDVATNLTANLPVAVPRWLAWARPALDPVIESLSSPVPAWAFYGGLASLMAVSLFLALGRTVEPGWFSPSWGKKVDGRQQRVDTPAPGVVSGTRPPARVAPAGRTSTPAGSGISVRWGSDEAGQVRILNRTGKRAGDISVFAAGLKLWSPSRSAYVDTEMERLRIWGPGAVDPVELAGDSNLKQLSIGLGRGFYLYNAPHPQQELPDGLWQVDLEVEQEGTVIHSKSLWFEWAERGARIAEDPSARLAAATAISMEWDGDVISGDHLAARIIHGEPAPIRDMEIVASDLRLWDEESQELIETDYSSVEVTVNEMGRAIPHRKAAVNVGGKGDFNHRQLVSGLGSERCVFRLVSNGGGRQNHEIPLEGLFRLAIGFRRPEHDNDAQELWFSAVRGRRPIASPAEDPRVSTPQQTR